MFGFLSQNIYALVDTFWVSKLPEQEAAVAAVTFMTSLLWLFFSFNQLVGPGSVAVISRRYGEKAFDQAEKAIRETIVLKLLFGVFFAAAGFFFIEPMLALLGAEGDALRMGAEYGRVVVVGIPIGYAMYSIFTAMRSVANPKMAMSLMIGSNLLNMALDPVFIFGYFGVPAFGISGAAIASIVSMVLTLGIGLALFVGHKTNVPIRLRGGLAMSAATMWQIVRIGIPAWLGGLSYSGARLILTPLIATFGTQVVAAYGVGNQVTSFGIMVLVGIGLGLASLIGHSVGAGKTVRAKKTADASILLGLGIMVILGLIAALLPRQIMGFFFQQKETIEIGVVMLRVFALGFPFMGAFLMVEDVHAAVGMNTPGMVFNVIHAWLLQLVPIVFLTQWLGYGVTAIWWSITLSSAVSAIAFYLYYRRGRWLHATV
jgi:putative MATE family efflux protein